MPNHDIRANLIFDPRGGVRGFHQVADASARADKQIGMVQRTTDGLVGKLLAVGGAYASLNTAFSIFGRLTSSAIKYTSALDASKIGLGSVLSAVENVPWERATKMAGEAFEKIKQMSIASPAGPQEMFEIFNGIIGPVRAAGAGLEKVYELTNDTTLAAAALGVDYAQASRDISMIARGTAGVDVKLFSMLRSTGAIAEDTETWNKNLTGMQRVEKLGAALKKFAGSGEAFGKSWAGVMSTAKGLGDELKRTTFSPIMRAVASTMDRFNTALIANSDLLESRFERIGTGVVRIWDALFGRLNMDSVVKGIAEGATKVGNALQTVATWTEALTKGWGKVSQAIHDSMPMLKVLAGIYLGNKVMGAMGGGGAAGALGGGGGGAGGTTTVGGDWRGKAATAQRLGVGYLGGQAGGPLGGLAAGKAQSMTNYKTASLVGLLNPMLLGPMMLSAWLNEGKGTEVAGGGGAGGVAGAGAGKFTELAGSMSAAIVVAEHWTRINAALAPTLEETEKSSGMLAQAAASAGLAIGRLWGKIEVGAKGIWVAIAPVFNTAQQAVAGILDHVTIWADKINYYLAPAFDYAIGKLGEFASALSSFLAPIAKFFAVTKAPEREGEMFEKGYELPAWASGGAQASKALTTPDARKPSVVNNVNASGARVTIKQEFGNQDPDRVVQLMMNDLENQAESRISSAFTGAFTR